MSDNPYASPASAEELPTPLALTESESRPTKPAPAKRKTNWFTITGALIGLSLGFLTATYPEHGIHAQDPGFESGQAVGRVIGHAVVLMMLGGFLGWYPTLIYRRPLRALALAGALFLVVGFLVTYRVANYQQKDLSSQHAESSSGTRKEDLTEHQEAGRIQMGDGRFSVVPPEDWRRIELSKDLVGYIGPPENGFVPNFSITTLPDRDSFNAREIEKVVLQTAPTNAKVLDSGLITIDGQEGLFVSAEMTVAGQRHRDVKYIVPGRYNVFKMTASWREPASAATCKAFQAAVASALVD